MKFKTCEHLENLDVKKPDKNHCEECLKSDSSWVHLRKCQTCGKTLCCESSENQHMLKHFENMGHGVIVSAEPGEKWAYCYKDKTFKKNVY